MQPPGADDDVVVTFYCKDPDSQGDKMCETIYATDRGSWMVHGQHAAEAEAEAEADLLALGVAKVSRAYHARSEMPRGPWAGNRLRRTCAADVRTAAWPRERLVAARRVALARQNLHTLTGKCP